MERAYYVVSVRTLAGEVMQEAYSRKETLNE